VSKDTHCHHLHKVHVYVGLQTQQDFLAPLLKGQQSQSPSSCSLQSSAKSTDSNSASAASTSSDVKDADPVEAKQTWQYVDTRWRLVQVHSDDIDVASRHDLGYRLVSDWLGPPGGPMPAYSVLFIEACALWMFCR
jgi:hypothetical protein